MSFLDLISLWFKRRGGRWLWPCLSSRRGAGVGRRDKVTGEGVKKEDKTKSKFYPGFRKDLSFLNKSDTQGKR
jgi:hypothetical protein